MSQTDLLQRVFALLAELEILGQYAEQIPKEQFSNKPNHIAIPTDPTGAYCYELEKIYSRTDSDLYTFVFIAHKDGKKTAIKLVTGIDIFIQRELNILEKCSHPNIIRYYGRKEFTSESISCLFMEYLGNELLTPGIVRQKNWDSRQVAKIFYVLGQILWYLEVEKILHRDIKPEHIWLPGLDLLSDENICKLKLYDFGIAKRIGDDKTRQFTPSMSKGTQSYMSPEQYIGNEDHRSDLYSLGITLYVILTGNTQLFPNEVEPCFYQKSRYPEIASPDKIKDEAFVPIINKMVARPEKRYQSASEFMQDLVALVGEDFLQRAEIMRNFAKIQECSALSLDIARISQKDHRVDFGIPYLSRPQKLGWLVGSIFFVWFFSNMVWWLLAHQIWKLIHTILIMSH